MQIFAHCLSDRNIVGALCVVCFLYPDLFSVGKLWLYNRGYPKATRSFQFMIFLLPDRHSLTVFRLQQTEKGNAMKIKIFIIYATLLCVGDAYAKCATLGFTSGTCLSNGGVLCADGGCYVCCDSDNTSTTTVCSGTYTTDTSLTFSDATGSGYYKRHKYTKSCKCLEL